MHSEEEIPQEETQQEEIQETTGDNRPEDPTAEEVYKVCDDVLETDLAHTYERLSAEGEGKDTLQFLKKESKEGTTELELVADGWTNEQLIAVLHRRLSVINEQFPCNENANALQHLHSAGIWLRRRTANRTKRGVEGKNEL